MGIYGLTFERCPSVFCSFYLTTHFLLLEEILQNVNKNRLEKGEKREFGANVPSFFCLKKEGNALFLHKTSERKVP